MQPSRLVAIVVGGAALGGVASACGGSSTSFATGGGASAGSSDSSSSATGGSPSSVGSSGATGGASTSGVSSSGDGSSSNGSSAGGSSSVGSSSSSASPTSSASSSGSGGSSSSGSVGAAIPLASPEGADFDYTAQVTVGNQSFILSIDTGSTTLGVAGKGCSGCAGVTPVYTPSASAMATGQKATSSYVDGSSWSGPVYSDTVGLGYGTPNVSIDLVEITKAKEFFDSQNDYQGILGIGPQGNALPGTTGYMPAVLSAGVANIFAFQLCDNTGANAGTMWIGGDGSPGALTYTPLVPITSNNPFYAIDVDAVSLGGTTVVTNASATFEQPVLDTGTSLFYVPTSVFNAFQAALQASSGFQAVFGTNTIATSGQNQGCVTDGSVTDAQVESMLPPIVLSLPNMTSGQPDVTIQASALDTYLYDGGGGSFCLAIQDGGTQDPSTFGDAFLQAFVTVVDLQNSRVGFAPTGCVAPQARRFRHPAKNGPHRLPRLRRP